MGHPRFAPQTKTSAVPSDIFRDEHQRIMADIFQSTRSMYEVRMFLSNVIPSEELLFYITV